MASLITETLRRMGCDTVHTTEAILLAEDYRLLWRIGFAVEGTPKYAAFFAEMEDGPISVISKMYDIIKKEEAKYATV